MDAQNAGNDISGIQISKNFPDPPPPIHAWYIGYTRGLQLLLSPSNILSHRKVPFQKMPPTGKSSKKALVFVDATVIIIILLVFSISGINSTGLIILISTHSYFRKHSFQCDSNKQYSRLSRGMADTIRDDPYQPIQYK